MTEKTTETAIVQAGPTALVKQDYGIDVARVIAMRSAVEEVISKVLREGEHFGILPGSKVVDGKRPKKMLFQPGAEVLCQVFRLRPQFEVVTREERDDFIFREVTCRLYNSVTGELVGEASGSANSREEKYAARTAAKLCPTCGKPTIFRSKKRPGDTSTTEPGWFCWSKKGGCGAEFAAEDKKLLDQSGAISTDKLWDLHHTILSMSQKRAYVKSVRNATATSDIFTDEDAPPEDDQPGQPGAQHARTQTKASTAPKATAIQVRDLNEALKQQSIGTTFPDSVPVTEHSERGKKVRLGWVNQMLADDELPEVGGMSELSPEIIDRLIVAAKAGKVPAVW
jgi:hypothetical protein